MSEAGLTATAVVASLVAMAAAGARTRRHASGEPEALWRVDGAGRGTPAIDASSVYFLSHAHEVIAVDAKTGLVRWKNDTGKTGEATDGSSVVLAGPVVVAGDDDLVAFDRRDGAIRWTFAPADGTGVGMYLGTVADDIVYAGSSTGHLYAVDASGRPRWSAALANEDTTVFDPIAAHGLVAAAFLTFGDRPAGAVVVLDAATGRERWRRTFDRGVSDVAALPSGSVLWAGGTLVFATRDGTIHAVDAAGREQWTAPPLADARVGWPRAPNDFRPVAEAAGRIVAGSLAGIVVAYDEVTGREQWRSAPVAASVALALAGDDECVYVPYLSGELVALDARDGRERWRTGGTAGFKWKPTVSGDRVYAAATRAGFFAFRR